LDFEENQKGKKNKKSDDSIPEAVEEKSSNIPQEVLDFENQQGKGKKNK